MFKVPSKGRNHDEVLTLDRKGLLRLIDDEAQRLGLNGEEALAKIEQGTSGDNYLWTDISFLADLLRHAK